MHRFVSVRMTVYLLLLLVADLSVSDGVKIFDVRPVFLYLLVLYAAFEWGWQQTVPAAFAAGLLRDLAGLHYFGLESLSLVLAAIVLGIAVQKVERDSLVMRLAVGWVFVFSVHVLFVIFAAPFTNILGMTWHNLLVAGATAGYTVAWLPVFFFATSRWFQDRLFLKQYELFK